MSLSSVGDINEIVLTFRPTFVEQSKIENDWLVLFDTVGRCINEFIAVALCVLQDTGNITCVTAA